MTSLVTRVDPLIFLILGACLLAFFFPAAGHAAVLVSLITSIAIAILFFLYGARLSTHDALKALAHWRLHLTIASFTYLVFPLIGLALQPLSHILGPALYAGMLYLTLVPSTVQSSIAFTSIAGGNVGGAIISASLSNLLGVVLTPVLVMTLLQTNTGVRIDAHIFANIAFQLLLPFVLGQLARPWIGEWAGHKLTKIVDRGSITLVVYSAMSAGFVANLWSQITTWHLGILTALSVIIVVAMLMLSRTVAKVLRFSEADTKAIQFCGSKKSLATGLPMAAIIFGGGDQSILILPLMIFHQVQLLICSWLAARYAHEAQKGVH
ncbi:bile acid:sodium symporter family protein [Corynebacterium sp. HS2168-gen11]|uniref:bile acid:sodium symporter family protein n=1 Tax=Corynebacterium sp. HS2168-gen11 TaxID=2974027 RepID=UPI00216AEEAE|nr:bile acid:sodium symporter family protein [Corynebacterium sp. HS2168-gen11]MCS4535471.1 bile acid:sodium symporter [Corynebacterium sp. HS2168-gen11]